MERRAAIAGGGELVAPVQTVPDFMSGVVSGGPLPSSSYRLGVREAPLHDLYPSDITEGLRQALQEFNRRMPGFIDSNALLHGKTRRYVFLSDHAVRTCSADTHMHRDCS